MSGAVAGLIGSLKSAVVSIVNKYFVFPRSVEANGNVFAARDIISDSSGNVYVSNSGYLYKYSKDGVFQWAKTHGGLSGLGAYFAIDSSNIYISTINSSAMPVVTALSLSDGSVVWSKKATTYANQNGPLPILILNSTQLVTAINHEAAFSKDTDDGYVVTLNKSDGSMAYSTYLGYPIYRIPGVDPSGNAWVYSASGTFKLSSTLTKLAVYNWTHETLKWDASGNVYGVYAQYVYKFNSSLTATWRRNVPTGGNYTKWNASALLDIDASGNVYFVSGSVSGTNISPIVKLNSDGTLNWARSISAGSVYSTITSNLRLTSDEDILVNIGSISAAAKLKTDGVVWGPVTTSGTAVTTSLISYTTTSTATTSISPFATTTSGFGNFPTAGTIAGWSTNTFTQTSTSTVLDSYYIFT